MGRSRETLGWLAVAVVLCGLLHDSQALNTRVSGDGGGLTGRASKLLRRVQKLGKGSQPQPTLSTKQTPTPKKQPQDQTAQKPKQPQQQSQQTQQPQSEAGGVSSGLCLNAIRSLDDYTISRMMNGWNCAKHDAKDDEREGLTLCSRTAPWVFSLFRPVKEGTLGSKDWRQVEQGTGAGIVKSLQLMYPNECGSMSPQSHSCKVGGQEQLHHDPRDGSAELATLLEALEAPPTKEAFYVHIYHGADKTHHFVIQKHDAKRFRLIQSWQQSGAVPWSGYTVKEWLAPAPTGKPSKHQPANTKQDHDDNIKYARSYYGGGQWVTFQTLASDLKSLLTGNSKAKDDAAVKMFGRQSFAPTSLEWVRSGAGGDSYTQEQCVNNVKAMEDFFASTKHGPKDNTKNTQRQVTGQQKQQKAKPVKQTRK